MKLHPVKHAKKVILPAIFAMATVGCDRQTPPGDVTKTEESKEYPQQLRGRYLIEDEVRMQSPRRTQTEESSLQTTD